MMNSKDLPTQRHPDVTDRAFPRLALANGVLFVKFSMAGVITLKDRKCRGFTLLEVMVAMAFIAITLMAVLDAQSGSLSRACEAKFSTTASLLAQKKIAELEIAKTEDLTSDSGEFGDDFPGYYWKLTTEMPSFDSNENLSGHLKQIDLTISWGEDELYSYSLRLYRFSPEIK
jgi:general secretion pathway protein I